MKLRIKIPIIITVILVITFAFLSLSLRYIVLQGFGHQGEATVLYFILALIVVGIIFIAGVLLIFERMVFLPIAHLSADVENIGTKNEFRPGITVKGKDELASLTRSINGMLDRIDASGKELRKSEERFRLLAENARDFIFRLEVSPERKFAYISPSATAITGYSPEEFYANPGIGFRMFYPEDRATFMSVIQDNIQNTSAKVVRWRRKDGRIIWMEFMATPIFDANKNLVAIEGIARDITERKKSEEALFESAQRYRNVVENAAEMIQSVNLDGNFIYVNPAWLEVMKYTKEELATVRVFDIIDPEYRTHCAELFNRAIDGERFQNIQTVFIAKNGKKVFVEGSISPRITGNSVMATYGIFHDITARKKAEDALRASEEKFRNLVANLPVGVSISTMNGRRIETNLTMQLMHGYDSKDEFMNDSALHVYANPEDRIHFIELLENGPVVNFEVQRKRKDGTTFWALQTAIPFGKPEGEQQYLVVVQDITERKQAEEALKRRLELEKAVSSISSSFVGAEDIDNAINYTLADIGNLSRASRVYIFMSHKNDTVMDETHEWCAPGIESRMYKLQGLPTGKYRWWMEKLLNGETINIGDVSNLPGEASAEKEFLGLNGVKSALAMPVYIEGKLAGFMGLENSIATKEWGESDFTTLRVACEIIGNALERQKIDKELKESERNYRSLFETMAQGAVYQDNQGNIISMNDAASEILGLTTDQMQEGSVLNIPRRAIHEDGSDFPRGSHPFQVALKIGKEVNDVVMGVFNPKDKTYRWIKVHARPVFREGDERPFRVYSTFEDITELKKMEQIIKASEEKYRNLVENAPVGISISTFDGTAIDRNAATQRMHGYESKDEFMKLSAKDLYYDITDRSRFIEAMRNGPVKNLEVRRKRKDGSLFWASLTSFMYKTASNEQQFIIVTEDITERKEAQEKLAELYEQVKSFNAELEQRIKERTRELEVAVETAEAASRAKSEFLSNMSHELRTPLTAVIGFSQVLQEQYFGELNDKQKEYVKDILESGQHLLVLINDVLDLAKVEAGKMELELSQFDVRRLVDDTLLMVREKALKHNLTVETHFTGSETDFTLTADRLRIKQVLLNLLSNSVKFTPDGGKITIEAVKRESELEISVADTGIGIELEYQKRIFEVFFQVQSHATDKTPGTGLGLSLCKRFVEMHGGKIWFESEGKNKGTRFTFTLPLNLISSEETEGEYEQSNTYSRG